VVEDKFEKYRKMQKRLPKDAIQHRMKMDGISQQEIDGFFNNGGVVGSADNMSSNKKLSSEEKLETLTKLLDEAKVLPKTSSDEKLSVFQARISSYEKTFKAHKDIGEVRVKMRDDKCSEDEVNMFCSILLKAHNKGQPTVPTVVVASAMDKKPPGMDPKPILLPNQLSRLHWKKLKNSDIPNTIWYQLHDFPLSNSWNVLLKMWFEQKPSKLSIKMIQNAKPSLISLLPHDKNNKILIVLTKLKRSEKTLDVLLRLGNNSFLYILIEHNGGYTYL